MNDIKSEKPNELKMFTSSQVTQLENGFNFDK